MLGTTGHCMPKNPLPLGGTNVSPNLQMIFIGHGAEQSTLDISRLPEISIVNLETIKLCTMKEAIYIELSLLQINLIQCFQQLHY